MGFVLARHKTQARETVTIPRIKVDESQRICRQILVRQQQLTGIWFSSSLGRKKQPNNNNLSGSCMYGNIRLPVVSLPSAASWKRHSSYFSSFPVCFWVGWAKTNTDGLPRKANSISTCTAAVGGAISAPFSTQHVYSPVSLFLFLRGSNIFSCETWRLPYDVRCHNSRFLFLRLLWERAAGFVATTRLPSELQRSISNPIPPQQRVGERRAQREKEFRVNSHVFDPFFYYYYYFGFLACRRVVVVDPISLFIPLNQNQFDIPSLSLVEEWRVDIENSSQL